MANSISATKKGSYTKKTGADTYTKYHFETDTKQVILDEAIGELTKGSTLHDALASIKTTAEKGGQGATDLATHVADKKNPHGVTKAQVGLGSVVNQGMDITPTSGSSKYVTSDGVFQAITYVQTQLQTNLETVINEAAIAQTAAATAKSKADSAYSLASGKSASFVFTSVNLMMSGALPSGNAISGYKVGDNIYLSAKNVPDFWISNITNLSATVSTEAQITAAKDGQVVLVKWGNNYVSLIAVESKTDLSGYYTSAQVDSNFYKKSETYTKTQIDDKDTTIKNNVTELSAGKQDIVCHFKLTPNDSDISKIIDIATGDSDTGTFTFSASGNDDDFVRVVKNGNDFIGIIYIADAKVTLPIYASYSSPDGLTAVYRGTAVGEFENGAIIAQILRVTAESYSISVRIKLTSLKTAQDVKNYTLNRFVLKADSIAVTGDVTGTGSQKSGINLALTNTGVTAGTYSAVTVDSKGRVTNGANSFVFATSLNDTKLNDLASGGIAIIDA